MFENGQYQNPYSGYVPSSPYSMSYAEEMAKLKEENKRLKEQQMQMSDPMYVEFQNTPQYQNAKKDNVLTFLFASVFPQWQASELGKAFIEWDKKEYEIYKQNRMPKSSPNMPINTAPQTSMPQSNNNPNSQNGII